MGIIDTLAFWRKPAQPMTQAREEARSESFSAKLQDNESPFSPLSTLDRDALIRTLYGEARGESEAGQIAVAHVVRNRAKARGTTAAIECRRPWQFSCWNAGDPNLAKLLSLREDDSAYQRLAAVVDRAWAMPDTVHGARHYFVAAMRPWPSWAKAPGREVTQIGAHSFWAGVA